jgi:hypothetical protein
MPLGFSGSVIRFEGAEVLNDEIIFDFYHVFPGDFKTSIRPK